VASPNPYAAPRSSLDVLESEGAPEPATWRLDGDRLIARKGVVLPPICLHSAETIEGQRVRAELSWIPVWFKVFVVVAPVIGAFAFSYVRRGGAIDHALGAGGRRRRRNAWLSGLAVMAAFVLFMGLAVGDLTIGLAAIPLFSFPVALVVGWLGRSFKVLYIDRHHIHLGLRPNVAAAFARLPPGS
jgi:hypothetical protein